MLMSAPFSTRNCAVPACPSAAECRGVLWWGEISYTIMNIAWLPDCIYPISLYGMKLPNNSNERLSYRLSTTLAVHCTNTWAITNTCMVMTVWWVSFASLTSSKHNTSTTIFWKLVIHIGNQTLCKLPDLGESFDGKKQIWTHGHHVCVISLE